MQLDVDLMMRDQLYKDGYVLCYSGMKTRRSASDPVAIAFTSYGMERQLGEESRQHDNPYYFQ